MTVHRAYVGMGSNLGDREQTLYDAFAAFDRIPRTQLAARSSVYLTEPIAPSGEQQDYCNAVAALDTELEPRPLLDALHAIEAHAGRMRDPALRNTARTLDLDLLLFDDRRIDEPGLSVPHPRLTDRAFVVVPLAEIAPDCVIPDAGPVRLLLDRVRGQRISKLPARAGSAGGADHGGSVERARGPGHARRHDA